MPARGPGPSPARPPGPGGSAWQRQAAGYHLFFSQFTLPVTAPLLAAAHVTAGARVLDVATGPGYAAGAAGERGARVLAIDLSTAMLTRARAAYPGLPLVQADAGTLPVASRTFTAVVANFYAVHMADPAAGIAELTRVLAPGGWLALSAWDNAPGSHPAALLDQAIADVTGAPAGSTVTSAATARLPETLTAAGLDHVTTVTVRWTHPVADAGALWDGLLASPVRAAAAVLATSPQTQQQIRDRFHVLTVAPGDPAGTFQLPLSAAITAGQQASHGSPRR